ncbi:hypothetical protein ACLOJK_008724 [Asimina triloba]
MVFLDCACISIHQSHGHGRVVQLACCPHGQKNDALEEGRGRGRGEGRGVGCEARVEGERRRVRGEARTGERRPGKTGARRGEKGRGVGCEARRVGTVPLVPWESICTVYELSEHCTPDSSRFFKFSLKMRREHRAVEITFAHG